MVAYIAKFENQHSLAPYIYLTIQGQVAKFDSAYFISKCIKSESCHYYFILIDQCYHDKQETTKKRTVRIGKTSRK